jgi:SAM-dependent methyltransferase
MTVSALRYGAGVKGKIIESLAAGVPVVTTAIGNEGIGLRPGVEALIADTPNELADHIIRLFEDPTLAAMLSREGRKVVAQRFSETSARDGLMSALRLRFCSVCGGTDPVDPSDDVEPPSNWREAFACKRCFALNRVACLADVLLRGLREYGCTSIKAAVPYLSHIDVHEFSATGPLQSFLLESPRFTFSEYIDDVAFGARSASGVLCQDIQNLTFGDASKDLMISSDVFEHIADPVKGFSEIYRVLRPGGAHVFTVPWNRHAATVKRAAYVDGALTFLLPAVYHGDPVRPGGALVFHDFGGDMLDLQRAIGFEVIVHEKNVSGMPGGYVAVFEARKPGGSGDLKIGSSPSILDGSGPALRTNDGLSHRS